MSLSSPDSSSIYDRIQDFLGAGQSGCITPDQLAEFEQLLSESEEAQNLYAELIQMSVYLPRALAATATDRDDRVPRTVIADGLTIGTVGYFTSDWPVAYLMATVIFGIGLLIGSVVHVSDPVQVVRETATLPFHLSPLPSRVGRITGMVDCQFVEGSGFRGQGSEPMVGGQWSVASGQKQSELRSSSHQPPATSHLVSLGDQFALSSGLMEITYDTGAKVILQGPVTYEVKSTNGGYLARGKLTARVESGEWRVESKSPNLQISKSPNPSLSTLHSPLFTIKTPTATVTDLGTEFGVEVSQRGDTISHVFRGSVELRTIPAHDAAQAIARILHENQWASVKRQPDSPDDGAQITVAPLTSAAIGFVRELPRVSVKTLDLVDVVSGGDGFSGRRDRGIDPTSGRPIDTAPADRNHPQKRHVGDGKYHRVEGLKYVDGVFIPDGRRGPVQIDSAGHAFPDFPETCNVTAFNIWAGGVIFTADGDPPRLRTELGGVDYASSGHGLLFLHANNGITFSLDAIRRANPNYKLLRFRATGGNTEAAPEHGPPAWADLWVLVDGQERFKRREINHYSGALPVAIPIRPTDRFLTLVATDGGDGERWDWTMFGDPRLEFVAVQSPESTTGGKP